jgi:hypothetical protein
MVMAKVLRVFALLMAASMLLWIAGCGDDDDDDDCADNVAPTVTIAPNGGEVAAGQNISVTFDKPVTATATGATLAGSGAAYTFTLTADGTVTVTGEDDCGDTVTGSATFTVGAADPDPPELEGDDCEPPDGDDGVDPASVEEILLVFNEDIAAASVDSFEPDANVQAEIDGAEVTIEFLGDFSLGNEQEVVVEITVEDASGNEATIEYSFTTMAKE